MLHSSKTRNSKPYTTFSIVFLNVCATSSIMLISSPVIRAEQLSYYGIGMCIFWFFPYNFSDVNKNPNKLTALIACIKTENITQSINHLKHTKCMKMEIIRLGR